MPVLAVTDTTSGLDACFFLSAIMMAFRSKDFPVPVKIIASPSMQLPTEINKRTRKRKRTYLPSQ